MTVALTAGRGLDGRSVARGRLAAVTGGKRRTVGRNRRLVQRRRGRGLRGARVQARLGRRTGGNTGKPTAQIEPYARFWLVYINPIIILKTLFEASTQITKRCNEQGGAVITDGSLAIVSQQVTIISQDGVATF